MGLPMFMRARGAGSRRWPCEDANAVLRMQAGNATAAASAGFL